jgi:hypothetical protein
VYTSNALASRYLPTRKRLLRIGIFKINQNQFHFNITLSLHNLHLQAGIHFLISFSNLSNVKIFLYSSGKLSTPTFHGDIRTFAQFKGDFESVIAPYYPNKVHQVHLLKYTALKGPAKALVENMSDLDQIWNRLDSRYGNPLEIVTLVVNDIENLKFNSKDHDKGIVQLVDTLEKGVWDLEAVQSRHEISTAYTVKLLESKLPESILNKWYDKEEDLKSTSEESKPRFESLLKFLETERKHAERRMLLKGKPSEEKKDFNQKERNKNFSGNANGTDPLKVKDMCLIHPDATHFTRKCKAFRSKSVEERGKLVFDLKACKLCLSIKHWSSLSIPHEMATLQSFRM